MRQLLDAASLRSGMTAEEPEPPKPEFPHKQGTLVPLEIGFAGLLSVMLDP